MHILMRLVSQPREFQRFWLYVFKWMSDSKEPLSQYTLRTKFNLSRATLFRYLKEGKTILELEQGGIEISINREGFIVFENKAPKKPKSIKKPIKTEVPKQDQPIRNPYVILGNNDAIAEIMGYLNEKTGKSFSPNSANAKKYVSARLKDGYAIEDFKKVIDVKVAKWKGTSMEDYLRPQTLFGEKFDGYLNEKEQVSGIQERFMKTQKAVDEAKNFDFFSNQQ
jgi:uncharacterized phage protein (TIGR02220 family)